MAEALLDTVLGKLAEDGKPAYEVLETYKGKDLEYKEYEPLYALCSRHAAEKQNKKGILCDLRYLCYTDRWYRCGSYRTCIW